MELKDDKCASCDKIANSGLFQLCLARDSQYVANGKQDWHTIQHMRTVGSCGPSARFYKEKGKTK